jgi:hypothetical protein
MGNKMECAVSDFLTIKQFTEKHKSFSASALRFYIYKRRENGFNKVVVRIGRKILIDEKAFLKWIESHRE